LKIWQGVLRILGLVVCLSALPLWAQTSALEYQLWQDESRDAGLEEAKRAWAAGEFTTVESPDSDDTKNHGIFWLRLESAHIANHAPDSQLVLRGKGIEVAELFAPHKDSSEAQKWVTGHHLARPSLAVEDQRNRLLLPTDLTETEAIYLRWQGIPPQPNALMVAPAIASHPGPVSNIYTIGIFRGAMLGIGVYYLFLFFKVRARAYGWLALYVLALAGYTIVQEGDLRYFGSNPIGWKNYWMLMHGLLVMGTLSSIQFARSFLNLPVVFPRWDRWLRVILGLNLLSLILLAAILHRQGNPYDLENGHTYLLLVGMLLQVGLAIACAVRGQRSAKLYALSFGVLCAGVWTDLYLNYWGGLKADPETARSAIRAWISPYSYYTGLLGEVFLMAFAVAAAINEIRNARDKANAAAIDSALETANLKESYNQDLERELAERTADVREKNTQLEERDTLKSRFFANLSHEFRTPLSLIRGPAEDLARGEHGDLDASGRRKLKTLLGQSEQLEGLIDQLLELSRLDAGKLQLRAGNRDFVKFAHAIVMSFSSLAEKRRVRIEFQSDIPDLELWFDEEMLKKVINNLVSNALKFTPHGGEIRVRVKDSGGELASLVVNDTGPGIAPEIMDRIFERFFQADDNSMHHQQGSGIGLALAKELVELHGGLIEAQSADGVGTRITFSLPKGRAHLSDDEITQAILTPESHDDQAIETVDKPIQAKPKAPEEKNRPTILIVEDMAEMRDYIRERLAATMNVLEAEDGIEGLKIARRECPELIISDVMMPRMDGISLLAEIRSDPGLKTTPVIMLTARGDEEDRLQGLAARADDYLTKPFNAQELLLRVENLLRTRSDLVADYRQGDQPVVVADMEVSSADREFLNELDRVVSENFAETGFQLDELARLMKASDATLRRRLKALLQLTPAIYLRTFRLQKAKQLIEARSFKTVAEVANATGFSSPGYFARLYQKEYGIKATEQLRQSSD